MLWSTLYRKLGKQPMKTTQHYHVHALLANPKTHRMEKVYLDLKFDASGHPYLVERKNDELYGENKKIR